MGPTKMTDNIAAPLKTESRPRRGSLPELKTSEKISDKDKKVPTGPRANPLYKTRLCMNFQSTGSCPYTEKCQFAHGVKELEKWESWRTAHNIKAPPADDIKGNGSFDDEHTRSRSQSLDKPPSGREMASGSQDLDSLDFGSMDFGSPQSLNWDLNTPVKSSCMLPEENTPFSAASSNFSLWSSVLDDIENDRPFRLNGRSRTSTIDSVTYDNMSQLRDAPTLFSSPPVLGSLEKLTNSH